MKLEWFATSHNVPDKSGVYIVASRNYYDPDEIDYGLSHWDNERQKWNSSYMYDGYYIQCGYLTATDGPDWWAILPMPIN